MAGQRLSMRRSREILRQGASLRRIPSWAGCNAFSHQDVEGAARNSAQIGGEIAMAQEATHDSGPEKTGTFPACCKDAGEKMAGCGPMMEKMMAHCGPMMEKMMGIFGAKTSGGESDGCLGKPEEG